MSHDGNGNVPPGDSEQPATEIREQKLSSDSRVATAVCDIPQEFNGRPLIPDN